MRDYDFDFDLNDDPVSLDMSQYADNDIDNFIRPPPQVPIGRGDVFVRFGSEPKKADEVNGSNCGEIGCNASGNMAQNGNMADKEKDSDEPVLDDDYDEKDIHNSIK